MSHLRVVDGTGKSGPRVRRKAIACMDCRFQGPMRHWQEDIYTTEICRARLMPCRLVNPKADCELFEQRRSPWLIAVFVIALIFAIVVLGFALFLLGRMLG